jgi:hypothetical protein
MAPKRKTIEYGFQSVSAELAPNTWRELSAITLYIPESSVTFKSVIIEWNFRTTSGSLINNQIMGVKLGAGSFDDVTDTYNANTYSSENESFLGTNIRDVTSYFTANWTGTSMTCQVRWKTPNTLNPKFSSISATLFVTYEYDDTSSTHVKTVRIPIESRNAACTVANTWYSVGTNQIPKLTSSGLLPESGVTIRHMSVNLLGTEGLSSASSVDTEMLARIDTGSANYLWFAEGDYRTNCPIHAILDVTSMDPTSTHDLQIQTSGSGQANCFVNIGGWLTVTYEFDPIATTKVLNSLILPIRTPHQITRPTSGDATVPSHEFYIPEPGTITLKQSAVIVQLLPQGPTDYTIGAGTQTPIAWDMTYNLSGEYVGQSTIVHRIDSGGAAASPGVTLSGGENNIYIDIFSATQYPAGHWRAFTLLNYESNKADDGVGAHSHSVFYIISPQVEKVYSTPRIHTKAIDITESNYFINGAMIVYKAQMSTSTDTTMQMLAEYNAGEFNEDGWAILHYSSEPLGNGENRMMTYQGYLDDFFAPYPSHPDDSLMNIETSRRWLINVYSICYGTISAWITYSSATYPISGSIFGYTGDGSGILVQLYRASDHKHILNATSSAGGGYSATWYDGNDNVYAATKQDSTHVGRSNDGIAT